MTTLRTETPCLRHGKWPTGIHAPVGHFACSIPSGCVFCEQLRSRGAPFLPLPQRRSPARSPRCSPEFAPFAALGGVWLWCGTIDREVR